MIFVGAEFSSVLCVLLMALLLQTSAYPKELLTKLQGSADYTFSAQNRCRIGAITGAYE